MTVLSRLVAEDERNPLFVRDAALASNDRYDTLSMVNCARECPYKLHVTAVHYTTLL